MATDWTVRAITRAMLPILLLLTLVELGSGLVLRSFEDTLLRYPSLLVLVPVTIGTAGNLGSVLAARLSTAFHLGTLSFAPDDETLAGNALATVALAATVFPAVGLGAWGLSALTGSTDLSPWTVLAVSLTSGLSLAVLAVVVTVVFAGYRRGYNPDTLVGPLVTTTGDVFGVLFLLIAVRTLALVLGGV